MCESKCKFGDLVHKYTLNIGELFCNFTNTIFFKSALTMYTSICFHK